MFARVITADAQAKGFDGIMRLARQQLPGARQQPGSGLNPHPTSQGR
jgi:hypothetical protein